MVKKGDGGSGLGKQLLKKQKIAKRGPKPNAEGYLHTADMQVHIFLTRARTSSTSYSRLVFFTNT